MERNIKHIRIDERLIHGQVATTWTKSKKVEQIIVVNDEAKNDPVIQSVGAIAVPKNVDVRYFGVDQFIEIVTNNPIKKATMLIFAGVLDVLKVFEAGFDMKYVNAGGMSRARPNREQVGNTAIFVTKEENKAFKKLQNEGVDIIIQKVPHSDVEKYVDPYR